MINSLEIDSENRTCTLKIHFSPMEFEIIGMAKDEFEDFEKHSLYLCKLLLMDEWNELVEIKNNKKV